MNMKILDSIKDNQVIAIIPARAGSKGVRNKNIRCLQGYPLIAYSIAAAKLSEQVDRVLVSTDSEYYADIAQYYGAEVPFLRPKTFALDGSKDIEFMEHAIEWLFENEHQVPEYFVHLRPTYPLRDYNLIGKAIERLRTDANASSLRSAHKAIECPFKWFQIKEDKYFHPICDGMVLDDTNNPRQAFPGVYIPDGYVDVLKTDILVKTDTMHGDNMIGFIVEDGIDVDNLKDMEKLEDIFKSIQFPILSYLKKNYKPLGEAEL